MLKVATMALNHYSFTAHYGDKTKNVEITEVTAGGMSYHIYIDRYFYGSFVRVNGELVHHSNKGYFTTDEIQILCSLIEEHF